MARRRGIKIAKGVRLNFNKTGTSLTVRSKGLFGKTHSSTIPLTSSHKSSSSRAGTSYSRSGSSGSRSAQPVGRYDFKILENGDIEFFDSMGQKIYDDSLIRKIKSTEQFKEKKRAVMEQRKEEKRYQQNALFSEIQSGTDEMINIHRMSTKVVSADDCNAAIEHIQPRKYQPAEFSAPKPMRDHIETVLYREAEQNVKVPFWKKKKALEEYVSSRADARYSEAVEKYESEKTEFERIENIKAEKANAQNEIEAELRRSEIRALMNSDSEYIEQKTQEWLESVTLTVDFSVDFEYCADNRTMCLDLHLPPINDIPATKAARLANGTVKEKNKTQKEIKQEYILCVFGLAVFVSSNIFNVSTAIEQIVVSGYSQHRDDKTGNIIDDCIYSLKFVRSVFENTDLTAVDPQQFCLSCESRTNITASLIMKPVEPFDSSAISNNQ